jgi:ADP-ribose pyrophosphatase YjhB (NUDIX family)
MPQPTITDCTGRTFACFPAVVLVFIVGDGKLLLLSDPEHLGQWQVVKGAIEAGETILDGALREVREEAGPAVRVRPLGTVHALTLWRDGVPYVVIYYLMAYEGGPIEPDDDMLGSRVRWWDPTAPSQSPPQNRRGGGKAVSPDTKDSPQVPYPRWLIERAIELARLWHGRTVDLQEIYPKETRT